MYICEYVNFDTHLNFFKIMYNSTMMIPMKAMRVRQMTMMIISRSSSGNPLCVVGVVVDVKLWPSVVESSSVVLCVYTCRDGFWTIWHVYYIENVELVLWFLTTFTGWVGWDYIFLQNHIIFHNATCGWIQLTRQSFNCAILYSSSWKEKIHTNINAHTDSHTF